MTLTSPAENSAAQTFADVPCTVCGCVCDDLQVSVSEGRITPISGACKLAEPWFDGPDSVDNWKPLDAYAGY